MTVAFVCDTPYQTLNVLNLYWHTYRENPDVRADLFIVDQFVNAQQLYHAICKEKLFDNVYILRREENRFMPQGLKRSIRVAYSYWNPKHAIANQLDSVDPAYFKNRYDIIFASLVKCITSSLLKLNPKAVFNLFDDGSGSYSGDLVANGGGLPYKIFSFIFRTGANAARAQKLYVNNVSTCHSTAADEICPLPKMDAPFLELAYRIFQIDPQVKSDGIVVLSQPFDSPSDAPESVTTFLSTLLPWKDRITVRMHPRDTAVELYSDFEVDNKGQIWELKISQMDMDRTVLICNYSTAQITPKMLYDKEPWLIFTHHIQNISTPAHIAVIDNEIELLRQQYRDKERIFVPHTLEEFTERMQVIMQRV